LAGVHKYLLLLAHKKVRHSYLLNTHRMLGIWRYNPH